MLGFASLFVGSFVVRVLCCFCLLGLFVTVLR